MLHTLYRMCMACRFYIMWIKVKTQWPVISNIIWTKKWPFTVSQWRNHVMMTFYVFMKCGIQVTSELNDDSLGLYLIMCPFSQSINCRHFLVVPLQKCLMTRNLFPLWPPVWLVTSTSSGQFRPVAVILWNIVVNPVVHRETNWLENK